MDVKDMEMMGIPGGPDMGGGPGGPGGPDMGGPGGGFPGMGSFKEDRPDTDWYLAESAHYPDGIELKEGHLPVGKDELYVLMTVDGVAVPVAPGKYKGDVNFTVYTPYEVTRDRSQMSAMKYRPAAVVKGGELNKEFSLTAALQSGDFEKGSAKNVKVVSDGLDAFNGIIIDTEKGETFSLTDSEFYLHGDGNSEGGGAAVTIVGQGDVKMDNVNIKNMGKASCIICSGNGSTEISNSVIYAQREPGSSKMCPWTLGLNGNNRGTNAIENAQVYYHDCIVCAQSWSTLSTDSGRDVRLIGKNVFSGIGTLEEYNEANASKYMAAPECGGKKYGFIIGESAAGHSGYVNYADGFHNSFEDVEFISPDYIFILSTGKATIDVEGDSKMYSARHGVLWHKNQGGSVNLKGGQWFCEKAAFLSKSYAAKDTDGCWFYLNVDGTDIKLGKDKVLYQLMTSDDVGLGRGKIGYTVPEIEDDWSKLERLPETYIAQKMQKEGPFNSFPVFMVEGKEVACRGNVDEFKAQNPTAEPVMWDAPYRIHDTYANFSNMEVEGSIFNAVWERLQKLEVCLDNVKLTGQISSSFANHVDMEDKPLGAGYFIDSDVFDSHLLLGRVVNVAAPSVNNEVALTLKGGSVWTVTDDSYLDKLTVEEGSVITGKVFVDGAEVSGAGSWEGKIVVK